MLIISNPNHSVTRALPQILLTNAVTNISELTNLLQLFANVVGSWPCAKHAASEGYATGQYDEVGGMRCGCRPQTLQVHVMVRVSHLAMAVHEEDVEWSSKRATVFWTCDSLVANRLGDLSGATLETVLHFQEPRANKA